MGGYDRRGRIGGEERKRGGKKTGGEKLIQGWSFLLFTAECAQKHTKVERKK